MRPIRILLIDDHAGDAAMEKRMIESTYPQVEVTATNEPPNILGAVFNYDAVIIDEHLERQVSGIEVAQSIHDLGWKNIQIMLMTGAVEGTMTHAYVACDYVCYKGQQAQFLYMLRAMMRQIERGRE